MSERKGDWIQLISGEPFWPLDARPEEVHLNDIAWALSMQCRYAGHVKRFYCPTPDQRVLTADLRWVPAGDLQLGDELLGFDEHPHQIGGTGKNRRRFRHATVLATQSVKRRVVRLEMADGSTVRSSRDHPWLVATKVSRNQAWIPAGDLADAITLGRRRYMHRFITPWTTDLSWEAGWLAGILDGEGHISFRGRTGVQFGVAQRPGIVLKEIELGFARLGFTYRSSNVGARDVVSLQILGGWRQMARMLGEVRPVRLLGKFMVGLRGGHFDKQMDGVGVPQEIVAAYDEGEEWVAGLETSTHTYLCEGYGAHNSVAEHSVMVSRLVPAEHALWGLLHDAGEAYLVDLPRPIKRNMPDYCAYEDALMRVIAERFELPWPEPEGVKRVDRAMLSVERRCLLAKSRLPWSDVQGGEWDAWVAGMVEMDLPCWSPTMAYHEFVQRYVELTPIPAGQP